MPGPWQDKFSIWNFFEKESAILMKLKLGRGVRFQAGCCRWVGRGEFFKSSCWVPRIYGMNLMNLCMNFQLWSARKGLVEYFLVIMSCFVVVCLSLNSIIDIASRLVFQMGGGGRKRLCMQRTSWTQSTKSLVARAHYRAMEALGFRCSLMLSEPYLKHSDTKWDKK